MEHVAQRHVVARPVRRRDDEVGQHQDLLLASHHGRPVGVEVAEREPGPFDRRRGPLLEADVAADDLGLSGVVLLGRDVEIHHGRAADGRVHHELAGLAVLVHLRVGVEGLALRGLDAHLHGRLAVARAGNDAEKRQRRVADLLRHVDGKRDALGAGVGAGDDDPGEHDPDAGVGEVSARAAELAVRGLAQHRAQVHVRREEGREEKEQRVRAAGSEDESGQSRGWPRRRASAASSSRDRLPSRPSIRRRERARREAPAGSPPAWSSCRRSPSGPATGCPKAESGSARRSREGSRPPARRRPRFRG